MRKKRILITGEGSYIGTNFIKWIGKWPDQYEVEEISVKTDEWKKHDFSKYDVILHVAAIVHKKEKPEMKELYHKINADLPYNIAETAKNQGVKQFIFLSTMSVYGLEGKLDEIVLIDETTPCEPVTYYGKSKLLAEQALTSLSDETFKVSILRPPMIYGEDCKGNYQRLIKLVKICPIFPDINNQRSMISIDHLCEFIKLTIDQKSSGLFFPQNNEYVSTKDLINEIANNYGKKVRFTKILNPLVRIASYKLGSINKLFGNLVYAQSISGNQKNVRGYPL